MNYDEFGRQYTTSDELADLLYTNPDLDLSKFLVIDPQVYNQTVDTLYAEFEKLRPYIGTVDMNEFDKLQQSVWYMPVSYQELDIAQWVMDQCKTDAELQRVGHELLLYQERNLFQLLRYLKYMVDTFRKNNIVWGLGRGSSVSSYVLYLIGVHKINSLYYDLPIEEFLR